MNITALLSQSFRLLARVAAPVVSVRAAWYNRRIVGQLAQLDDHMLRDMGLTRFDVESVLADREPSDPTLRLAVRAQEARQNRRAAALEQRSWAKMLSETEAEAAASHRPGRRAA